MVFDGSLPGRFSCAKALAARNQAVHVASARPVRHERYNARVRVSATRFMDTSFRMEVTHQGSNGHHRRVPFIIGACILMLPSRCITCGFEEDHGLQSAS